MSKLSKLKISNPKAWIMIGISVVGIIIFAKTCRPRLKAKNTIKEDFGAFIERFELSPFTQPPSPAARLLLAGLTFAIKDIIDVKGYVTGFGSVDWKRTYEVVRKTALVVALLKTGLLVLARRSWMNLALDISKHTPSTP